MADTRRLATVVEAASESRAKLLLVGDDAQLSPIGAGGLFGEISKRAPTAELTTVHRAREDWEREAWAQLRTGDSARALAAYASRDRLHIEDTRVEAGERMVDDWARVREANPGGRVVMVTDSSNDELDRLNALGAASAARRPASSAIAAPASPDRPYDLAAGDEVILTGQLRPPGEERLENGTRGTIRSVDDRGDRRRDADRRAAAAGRRVLDARVPRRPPRLRAARLQGAGPHGRPGVGVDGRVAERPRAGVCRVESRAGADRRLRLARGPR